MPPPTLLTIGPILSIVGGAVYAMPGRKVTCFVIGTGAISVANDFAMTTPVSFTPLEGQFVNSGGFISPATSGTIRLVAD